MLKPVKPRGDTSVAFVRLGYTSRSRQTSATEFTVRPECNDTQATALEAMHSSDVFNLLCWYSACLCTGNG